MQSISVSQLAQRDLNDLELVDVRAPVEFQEVRAVMAHNVPLDVLDSHTVMRHRNVTAEKPLYVICKSGSRGAKAQQKFHDTGFDNVVNVEGGTDAWVAAGLPVIRGKKVMSLQR